MNIPEIQQKLIENHRRFTDYMESLPDDVFGISRNGKWSPGQHLDHIRRSVQPLALGFRLPKWLIKMIFGRSNRTGRDYNELVKKYTQKLAEGGRASGRFIPKEVGHTHRKKLISSLNTNVQSLARNLNKFSESELENIVLPHPLLGKLTIKEMMYFTIYHAEHHHTLTANNTS
jgi:DinB superfamily